MHLYEHDLKAVATGVMTVGEQDGWYYFKRFAKEPEVLFKSIGYQEKVTATSSVSLDFVTDARRFSFSYKASQASSCSLCFFDLYVNEALVATQGEAKAEHDISGSFSWELPEGENHVKLYFPNLYGMALRDVELDGAAVMRPAKHSCRMICYGDSITQGYDSMRPSLTYVNRFAAALNADVINKGIGGDTFHPELIEVKEGFEPDIVSVAYGTNDWSTLTREVFEKKSVEFLDKIEEAYPKAEKIVITPTWRGDSDRVTAFGEFAKVGEYLQKICDDRAHFHVIDGTTLTAHVPELFADARLHPDDLGHTIYGANLSARVYQILGKR